MIDDDNFYDESVENYDDHRIDDYDEAEDFNENGYDEDEVENVESNAFDSDLSDDEENFVCNSFEQLVIIEPYVSTAYPCYNNCEHSNSDLQYQNGIQPEFYSTGFISPYDEQPELRETTDFIDGEDEENAEAIMSFHDEHYGNEEELSDYESGTDLDEELEEQPDKQDELGTSYAAKDETGLSIT